MARNPLKNYFVFRTTEQTTTGRPYLIAFSRDEIKSIKSIWGSENVYCMVNEIEVKCSFADLINELNGNKIGTPVV